MSSIRCRRVEPACGTGISAKDRMPLKNRCLPTLGIDGPPPEEGTGKAAIIGD